MTDSIQGLNMLGFLGPIGWQELLLLSICVLPFVLVGIILVVLTLAGVIGGKKDE